MLSKISGNALVASFAIAAVGVGMLPLGAFAQQTAEETFTLRMQLSSADARRVAAAARLENSDQLNLTRPIIQQNVALSGRKAINLSEQTVVGRRLVVIRFCATGQDIIELCLAVSGAPPGGGTFRLTDVLYRANVPANNPAAAIVLPARIMGNVAAIAEKLNRRLTALGDAEAEFLEALVSSGGARGLIIDINMVRVPGGVAVRDITPMPTSPRPAAPTTPTTVVKGSAQYDFGDAPRNYPTVLAERAMRHAITNVAWLGARVNGESNGLRTNRDQFDDGLLGFTSSAPAMSDMRIRVSVGNDIPADTQFRINVLVDRNRNGRWEPNELAVSNQVWRVGDASDVALVDVNGRPLAWNRRTEGWLRVTLTEEALANYDGTAPNNQPSSRGETEDYPPLAQSAAPSTPPKEGATTSPPPSGGGSAPSAQLDFGDAKVGFPTLLSENGPRHALSRRVWLGALVDGEADGAHSQNSDSDDRTGVDDEDGMLVTNPFTLRVSTGNIPAGRVYINAWEDWNGNGQWENINADGTPGDEWIVRNQRVDVLPNAQQDVDLVQPRLGPDGRPLPAAWSNPSFQLRFTITEAPIPNGNPAIGRFPSGETEDYIGVPSAGEPRPLPSAPRAPASPSTKSSRAPATSFIGRVLDMLKR